ncbi:hypothetical protein ACFPBZ_00715 [Actinomycetospora atypica]|uniref:Glucuronyl hydrolase n=1 Tax=Actinomycetospora atypica TaxID=1290095 RepID=A0ABV9YGT8_9PSEU
MAAVVLVGALLAGCGGAPAQAPPPPGAAAAPASSSGLPALVQKVLPTAYERLAATADSLDPAAGFPRSVQRGATTWTTEPVRGWTVGFFAGELWLARGLTGDPAWTARAQRWTAPIASQVTRTDTHDLGFVAEYSFGSEQRATGNGGAEVVTAARSLATRYSPAVKAVKSWDTDTEPFTEEPVDGRGAWRFPVIVDSLMNLPLFDQAAALPGGDPAWRDLATQHALTVSRTNQRPDGSIAHVAAFDPATGAFLKRDTWQGATPESTWSRGQGWAVHGFAAQARASGNPELRAAAVRAADWWLAHTAPGQRVPAWDFSLPTAERDSSAAAVAASGLLDLADQTGDPRYRDAAAQTLDELAAKHVAPTGPALLTDAVGNFPDGGEIGGGLVYGDYYFLEAVSRAS